MDMTIQRFVQIATSDDVAVSDIGKLAQDAAFFGEDVLAGLQAQIDRRWHGANEMLSAARSEDRSLLASEQRKVDMALRESELIKSVRRDIEARTRDSYRVPESQAGRDNRATVGPVLTKDQTTRSWLESRGHYVYAGERGAESLRFGAIIRALALGNRSGLSSLESRVLSEGTDSAGGYTVPEILASRFIDRVRNGMVVMRAGAVTIPMSSDTLHIARLAQPTAPSPDITTAQWKVENADIEETDMLLERVSFTARTLPVLLKMSVELSEDSINIEDAIERELSGQLALELDRVALLGSGSAPEPRGVLNQSGVGVTSLNAAPTDFDFLCDSIGRVWSANHEPTGRIYNSSLAVALAKLKDQQDQPLRAPDIVTAVPAFRTNQIPNAGTSPDDTTMFVADWSQLMIGLRTSFRLEVSRVSGEAFEKLQVWVRAFLRADIQLAHPEAFDVTTDVRF